MDDFVQPDRPIARSSRVRRVRVVQDTSQHDGAPLKKPTWRFVLWWALVNTIGAVVGVFITNTITGSFFDGSANLGSVGTAELILALLNGLVFGSIIGFIEWLMLRQYIPVSPLWVFATSVGWVIALVAITRIHADTSGNQPAAMNAIAMGVSIAAIPQSLALRGRIPCAGAWVIGNIVAWFVVVAGTEPISNLALAFSSAQRYASFYPSSAMVERLIQLIWVFGVCAAITGVVLLLLLRHSANVRQGNVQPRPVSQTQATVWIAATVLVFVSLFFWGMDRYNHPPRINIERSQYEAALARWRTHKVEEYEITTDTRAFLGGTLRLHVTDYGNKVEQLAPNVRLLDVLTDEDIEYLKSDTVEGLFAEIDSILRDNEVFRTGAMTGSGSFYMAYRVSFDPFLGYPVRIIGEPITEPGSYVSDADWDLTVTSLKIIKRGK